MIDISTTTHTEAAMNDVDMLASPTASAQLTIHDSIILQCTDFQSRVDSYTSELNRIQTENKAINLKLSKRAQEDRRDRLIDGASPEPRAVVHEGSEETMEMVVKETKERKRQLKYQLAQIEAGMDALRAEIEGVEKELNTLGQ